VARLPVVGSDNGQWGIVLNDFLLQSHKTDGSLADNSVPTNALQANAINTAKLQDNSVSTAKLQDNSMTTAKLQDTAVSTAKLQDDAVTAAKLATSNNPANGQVLGYSGGAMTWTAPGGGSGPQVFVQSTDPGASAQDGDIWIDTTL
jgi:hypothetical protein